MGTTVAEQQGHWVEPEVNYVDPERRFCAYCGRPIARRYWTSGEGDVAFCSPEHAARKAAHLDGSNDEAMVRAGVPAR